jgi:uncharacterized protein (DUF3820 family)
MSRKHSHTTTRSGSRGHENSLSAACGRHRGRRLDDIPLDYVRWLASECEDQTANWLARQFLAATKHNGDKKASNY